MFSWHHYMTLASGWFMNLVDCGCLDISSWRILVGSLNMIIHVLSTTLVLVFKVSNLFSTTTPFRSFGQPISVQHKINLWSFWHVMVEIQLSQISMTKLTTSFRLQAYLGATITEIKHSWFCSRSMIKRKKKKEKWPISWV